MGYRNDQINEWGSYEDRKNSYDDDDDLHIFIEMVKTNGALRSYIKRHTDLDQFTDQAVLKTKPNGLYVLKIRDKIKYNSSISTGPSGAPGRAELL